MFAASKTASASGGYQISRSLRFNSADSAYLNRTPASASNRKTWTLSTWIKRSKLSVDSTILSAGNPTTPWFVLQFLGTNNVLQIAATAGVSASWSTAAVFRDISAWYHIVCVVDTTSATSTITNTSTDRFRLYVNNVQQTLSGGTVPTQNADLQVNNTVAHSVGGYTSEYFDGYQTEVNFIDGQALTPSSFGETNAQTGVWGPKAYSGAYGTNGFYLNFSDNSNTTAATLGKDYSGNGNNWTPNNFSVTAGAGNDSLVDSPTSYGTDTGVGGTVRGNYCTLNPLNKGGTHTLTNGNLDFSISGATGSTSTFGTIGVSSGKWYWEMLVASTDGSYYPGLGVETNPNPAVQSGGTSTGFMYLISGQKYNNGSLSAYGSSFTTNDVIGVALDMDAGTITFYKNNTSQGQAFSGITGTAFPTLIGQTGGSGSFNFGQRAFAYTAPSGYKALCTQNLPTPTIGATTATQASKYFSPTIYTQAAGANTITTGLDMSTYGGLIWEKPRSIVESNYLTDTVRGLTKYLVTNTTAAEGTTTTYIQSVTSTGYTVAGGAWTVGTSMVSWDWIAGGTAASNTSGSITSTVSANTTSGFSVVTYGGNGANSTIGHGIGIAPSMIFIKRRGAADAWIVYHASIGNTGILILNTTSATTGNSTYLNNTSPTSSVFTVGTANEVNANGSTFVAYCFAPIAGYSAFGSYTGNSSTAGPFVYCGFEPAFLLIKNTSAGNWVMKDNKRSTYNVVNKNLFANLSNAETTEYPLDFLSNGFKLNDISADVNASGQTYIFMAFASAPLKYTLAF
jgi:hypothetical protein